MCSSFAQGIQIQSSVHSIGLSNQEKLFGVMDTETLDYMEPEDSILLQTEAESEQQVD